MDVQEVGRGMDRIDLAQIRNRWRALVNEIKDNIKMDSKKWDKA
jgi:hypothetical protein